MDPSSAPWRVLEGPEPAGASAPDGNGSSRTDAGPIRVAPLTILAVIGTIGLAAAAFVLAVSSTASGSVTVAGGTELGGAAMTEGSGEPTDAGAGADDLLVVEIAGAVRAPGVYRVPPGTRVGDLIEAAGGYGPRIDADRATRALNLAARVVDGDRVIVPSRDDPSSDAGPDGGGPVGVDGTSGSGSSPGDLVDLNRATTVEFEALPGIGPVTAGKIIAAREEAAFTSVEDLQTRKLVGAKTFDKIKDLVTVR